MGPSGEGNSVRRVVVRRRTAARLAVAWLVAALLCAAAGAIAGFDRAKIRGALAAARSENGNLRVRQKALRAHALEFTWRLDSIVGPSAADLKPPGGMSSAPDGRLGTGAEAVGSLSVPPDATQPEARPSTTNPVRR